MEANRRNSWIIACEFTRKNFRFIYLDDLFMLDKNEETFLILSCSN